MDSPLDVIDGSFTGAVLTTFTIELGFIDHWVVPRLASAGVRNIVILCDANQLARELAAGGSNRAGQQYCLAPVRARGAFHPKVIYLSGEGERRACISSANLTAAGQLRNLETAGVVTSADPGHLEALEHVRGFLLRLAEPTAAPVLESVLETLDADHLAATEADASQVRFVHNLDHPILGQLPDGAVSATAPFASGSALTRLSEGRDRMTVFLDERRPEAISKARDCALDLSVVRFGGDDDGTSRSVHGKAIWGREWCLVGSPNLTSAALLSRPETGNVEAALLFATAPDFELPAHEEVPVPDAPVERAMKAPGLEDAQPAIFTAVLEGDLLVDGLADGTEVEAATETQWTTLGVVSGGVVELRAGVPLSRLRARVGDDRHAYAVIHHAAYLRARRRTPTSRAAQSVERLPFDLEGVKELEAVLGNLYSLDSLAAEEAARQRVSQSAAGATDQPPDAPLESWKPARSGGEPRIPDLYRRVFEGDPDALLALVRNALRLEEAVANDVGLEDNEELSEQDADDELVQPERKPPKTEAVVVRRYRSSLLALLKRGAERLKLTDSEPLRDLTFLELLRFQEQLAVTLVRVPEAEAQKLRGRGQPDEDGMVEVALVEPADLVRTRWELLSAYAACGSELSGDCASVFMGHLAAAVADRALLEDTVARRLDDLCHRYAAHLIETADESLAELPWLSADRRVSLLEPFAERTDWYSIVDHCESEGWVTEGDLDLDPVPTVSGRARFTSWTDSPAWKLIGYSCIAGYEDDQPFMAIVHNLEADAPFELHYLRVEPTGRTIRGDRIHEALLRRSDGQWLLGTYDGFHRQAADRLLDTAGVHHVLRDMSSPDRRASVDPAEWVRARQES